MATKKKLMKQLGKIAGTLPSLSLPALEYHFEKGSDMIKRGVKETGPEDARVPVDPDLTYKVPVPTSMELNHRRGLKVMFKQYKGAGVQQYINAVQAQVKKHTPPAPADKLPS